MSEGWPIPYRSSLWVVPKGGGVSGWHKVAMWQMHITPSLWLMKSGGQSAERWNLC